MDDKILAQIESAQTVGIYSGEISVKVVDKKGKQRGRTKKFKNHGRYPLFEFFTTCLLGKYDIAEPLRPRYVKLFASGKPGDTIPTITDDEGSSLLTDFIKDNKERTEITYTYSTLPTETITKGRNLGSSSITYKFLIPFTHINTTDAINGVGLYNVSNYSDCSEPSAYFFVPDKSNTKVFGSLLETEEGINSKNYNLIIEWTLTIENVTNN